MARRWLLMLGSNLASDVRMREALAQLAASGAITLLTPIQCFPSDDGSDAEYFNALVTWQCDVDLATAVAQLKRIEMALGRRHDTARVTIDIDLLAECVDEEWQASAHALEKNEFGHATAVELLRQAGVVVMGVPSQQA